MSARIQRLLSVCSLALTVFALSQTKAVGQVIPKDNDKASIDVKSYEPVVEVKSAAIIPATITNDTFTNGGGTGLWGTATNWSAGLPTSSNNVLITGTGSAASVTENVSATINNLTLNSPDTWTLSNAEALTIDGNSIGNAGKMIMSSTGSTTELIIGSSSVTLSGGGTLTLSNNAANYIFGSAAADRLINQETIAGAGHIGDNQMTLVNSGTINANASAGLTIDANGGASNSGLLEATSGDKLVIANTTVYNTGGTISASGTGSLLELSNSNVYGGTVTLTGASTLQLSGGAIQFGDTVNNSSTGTIEAVGFTTNTLGGTVNNPTGGLLKIDNGAVLNLQNGTYPTLGAIQLNSSGNTTELVVNGGVTLSGGTVTLTNNAANYIFGAASGDTLTNQETIQGSGHIGDNQMTLVNSGTINANGSAGMTIQPNGGTTNTGTIEATAGATLALTNTTVANTGGTISANASILQVTNSTINGGAITLAGASDLQLDSGTIHSGSTVTNSATGTIEAIGFTTNTLGGTVVNPSGGLLKIDNGAVLNLESGSYPTLGAVQMNSTGNTTELVLNGAVTLSGGSMTLSNNAANYIFGGSSGDTFVNQETITGSGHIGNNQMTLINSGTINANASAGMTIQPNGGTTNTGTIEATLGATLNLSSTTVTNTGATISANASTLQVTNSIINGGTVTLTGASNLQLSAGTIQGGTLNGSSTGTIEAIGFTTSTLGGVISNPTGGVLKLDNGAVLHLENGAYPTLGAVQLNSTGNATELVINASATLSGGSVTLSNNPNNYIFGQASGDTLTNQETISGGGNIGDRQMTLINSGTINSNSSSGMTIAPNGGTTNTGTIEATLGSPLTLGSTTVNNLGGNISASGSNLEVTTSTINGGTVTLTGASTLQLNSSTIQGGTLTNSATGTIEVIGFTTNTLGGTVNNPAGGLLKLDNGAVLNLGNGNYPTLGAVQVNSTGNATELVVAGGVTLSGGSVTFSNNPNNYIFGGASGDALTNQETISGAGNIGDNRMTLVNSGTISANQSNTLFIQTNAFTNNGTLAVSSGDLMHVEGGIFTNFNPVTSTLTGGVYNSSGTLEIDNLGSTGGEIVTNAANIVLNGASATFVDSASKSVLTNLAVNAPGSGFTVTGGSNFTTLGNFTNNGTLTVGSGSKFVVNGSLTNFSGTTLTGGAYSVTGTLQFNGANIVTNAANITLTGTSSQIVNQTSGNGLASFATNAAAGSFSLQGGRAFTTAGTFSNAGIFSIGAGSTFTVGGTGSFTQTAGTTTDDGTLALPSSGKLSLTAGSLFGQGTISGAVTSSATVTPGDSTTTTGILKDTGAYTQNPTGILNVLVAGTTAGSEYDQLNPTTASLNGTLNIKLASGFVPAIGSTFKILNYTSETGTFATVTGLAINSGEHFTLTYQSSDVLLTVVSGAATAPIRPGIVTGPQTSESASRTPAPSLGTVSFAKPVFQTLSSRRNALNPRAMPAYGAGAPFNAIATSNLRPSVTRPTSYAVNSGAPELPRGAEQGHRIMPRKLLEYNFNVLSLFTGTRGATLHDMWKQPGDPSAPSFGSLVFTGSH